jgi:hypothetical protein
MEKWLTLQHFDGDDKLQNAVKDWLCAQITEFYEE